MLSKLILTTALLIGLAPKSDKGFGTYKAKELRSSPVWINSKPLTLKSLRGQIVFVDFWAFDCEPCIQAMPHVVQLYEKYRDSGVVFIGVHTPRADNERSVEGLRSAIDRMGIRYPVVVDDKQKTFRDYLCDLWPSQFIIDRDGIVRYSHGGVGRYEDMDQTIRDLLAETKSTGE